MTGGSLAPEAGLEQEWKWERSEGAKAHDATLKTGKRGLLHPAAWVFVTFPSSHPICTQAAPNLHPSCTPHLVLIRLPRRGRIATQHRLRKPPWAAHVLPSTHASRLRSTTKHSPYVHPARADALWGALRPPPRATVMAPTQTTATMSLRCRPGSSLCWPHCSRRADGPQFHQPLPPRDGQVVSRS